MAGRRLALAGTALAMLALGACKPPPTDAAMARAANLPPPAGPSAPLPSPDTAGAVWTPSAPAGTNPQRLVYGIPGQPVLVALECLGAGTADARLRITRQAPADPGEGALLALIGNGWIGRFPVDATEVRGARVWQGEVPASRREWDALKPAREATITVPGAGLVRLNPSPLPMQLIENCRAPAQSADRA